MPLEVEDQIHLDVTDVRLRQCLSEWAASHGFECTPVDGTWLCVHGWRIEPAPGGADPLDPYPVAAIIRHDANRHVVHCRLVVDLPPSARRPGDAAVLRARLEELLRSICPGDPSQGAPAG